MRKAQSLLHFTHQQEEYVIDSRYCFMHSGASPPSRNEAGTSNYACKLFIIMGVSSLEVQQVSAGTSIIIEGATENFRSQSDTRGFVTFVCLKFEKPATFCQSIRLPPGACVYDGGFRWTVEGEEEGSVYGIQLDNC